MLDMPKEGNMQQMRLQKMKIKRFFVYIQMMNENKQIYIDLKIE